MRINGVLLDVPGTVNDQDHFDEFFGVLQMDVPLTVLQENNIVEVAFNESGGRISSVSMVAGHEL